MAVKMYMVKLEKTNIKNFDATFSFSRVLIVCVGDSFLIGCTLYI
jgi:hypothetical protein